MRNENLSRCPELHLYILKRTTSNIRSKRRKRQSDLRGIFFITKNEEKHFRYPKSLPNIKMNKEEKSRATREFFIEKTGKTTPGYYRQVLKITTEISVLAKEKG